MTLTPSKKFMNISSCSFTPTGGSLITILGIKTVGRDRQAEVSAESADYDLYKTIAGVTMIDTKITIETINAQSLPSVLCGKPGVLVWTENDFTNGAAAGGGAVIYTVAAYLIAPTDQNGYRIFGTRTFTFGTISVDGSTDPLASAAA